MLATIIGLTGMGLVLGVILTVSARVLRVEGNPLAEKIEQLLPGTQCGQCGYPGCKQAAAEIACGNAAPTLCPPGGRSLAAQLADMLGVTLDLSSVAEDEPTIAFINEDLCVGCTRCFKRCPTDAIIGASKQIHTVIPDACTGCDKCVDVCPTECIESRSIPQTIQSWHWPKPMDNSTSDKEREAA